MTRPQLMGGRRAVPLYPHMYTLFLLSGVLLFGSLAAPAAAQRPQLPPGPPAEREGPVGPPAPPAPKLDRADVETWLDGYLPYALQRGDVAGAVVMVVKDGEILVGKGYGYADVEDHTPVDPARTLFRPGSVSKLFTWTSVMQLVEQGKLNLDADVNQYLDFKIPDAFDKPITLRHLMTHTPGFEEVNKNVIVDDTTGVAPLDSFLKAWTPTRIFPPGEMPAYSNYGTALAGYIVQRVSGESFDDYVERHIFGPLGMEHATFRQPLPARLRADMAQGYEVASDTAQPFEMVVPAPAGSLAASGEDMARFMIAHLQQGRFGDGRLLEPETAKLMHGTPLTILPQVNRMLLGFYETNRNGRRAIAHGGDTYFFHSDLHLFIDDGVGIFISMNSGGKDGAAGAIRSALFEQFADRYLPGETADGRVDPKIAMDHASLLAGAYDNSRRSESSFLGLLNLVGQAKVTVNEDTTISLSLLTGLNGEPKRWREISPFVWREVDGKHWLAAKVDGDEVVMLSGDEVSPFMMFLPAPWWRSSTVLWLLVGAAVIVLLTVVLWPITALVRRHYQAPPALVGREASAFRAARMAAAAVVIVLAAWIGTLMTMLSDMDYLSSRLDPWLWILQILTFAVFVGATLVALWHARVVWTGKRRWPARTWSLALAAACVLLLWVGFSYNLIGFSVHY
jgi:CubicO group peptidase (beta-lactamase class C family)